MAVSVAELRAEKAARTEPLRPTQTYRAVVGVGQMHVAELQALTAENDGLLLLHEAGLQQQGPRKISERPEPPARVAEIRQRIAAITQLMDDYEGDLTITRTKSDGDWAQWKLEHPAREEGDPAHAEDELVGHECNAADLLDDLATYVTHWNGEPLGPGDFDALELMRAERKEIAQIVVGMYERGANLPKLRSGLQVLLSNGPSWPSPADSASASDDSSVGNPPSDTSTTSSTGGTAPLA